MQIDLANTLVHKVYFLLVYLFLLSPLWSTISLLPSLGRGRGWAFSPSFGGGWGEASLQFPCCPIPPSPEFFFAPFLYLLITSFT